ncbi:MAG TPA: serine hydrolase domain-containing protein [Steroidobacteraceae bacterium]|nr:serine hydrolase domain-containing protein [Steroidobacteraceae bacterium]
MSSYAPFTSLLAAFLALLPVATSAAAKCAGSAAACSRLQSGVDDLARYGVLGAVVAIQAPRAPIIAITSGHTDASKSTAMDAARAFQVGSQTKMFTAAAILLLAKDGRLRLDDPVARFIPDAADIEGVTIRHLLTHTSGVGDGIDLLETEPPRSHYSFDDLLLLSRAYGRQFAPGARWRYNNTGFDMLGRIIEVASGESRSAFLRRRVLAPLGMRDTYVGTEEDWRAASVASGYVWSEKSGSVVDMTRPADLTWAAAAGDMISDAEDLLKWSTSLVSGRSPAALTLQDFTAGAVATGLPDALVEYGNGMGGFSLAGRRVWGHGGFIHGYITLSVVDPQTQTAVVVLASLAGQQGTQYAALKSAITTLVAAAFEVQSR